MQRLKSKGLSLDRRVRIERQKLLEILRKNRADHVQRYEAARKAYVWQSREKATAQLAEARKFLVHAEERLAVVLNQLEELDEKDTRIVLVQRVELDLPRPESFEACYDTVIRMVELDVRDTLELTPVEFSRFVEDDWDWSSDFDRTSKLYLS